MSAAKWFDTEAELQKLRSTPAKVAKPAKVDGEDTENFSYFSHFSRGACPESQISPPPDTLAAPFQDDGRETALAADAWPCPHCGQPATIDDVDWSADGERRLTFWSCEPCQVVAVTPDAIRQPPTGWVPKTRQ